jgi:electron transport complex protein RnfA
VSKDIKSAVGMSLAVLFVMIIATAATWPIQIYLLDPNNLGFMQIVVFIIIIAALVQLTEIVLKRYIPALYSSLGVYLPLMTTNCAIIAVTITNITEELSFFASLANALGAGLGFLLAMVLFSGIRQYTESAKPPASFEGLPLALVSAAILSLAFFGFLGVAENLFN